MLCPHWPAFLSCRPPLHSPHQNPAAPTCFPCACVCVLSFPCPGIQSQMDDPNCHPRAVFPNESWPQPVCACVCAVDVSAEVGWSGDCLLCTVAMHRGMEGREGASEPLARQMRGRRRRCRGGAVGDEGRWGVQCPENGSHTGPSLSMWAVAPLPLRPSLLTAPCRDLPHAFPCVFSSMASSTWYVSSTRTQPAVPISNVLPCS